MGFLPGPPPVSLPPLPAFLCAARFLDTAHFFCFLLIERAFAAGTHFAYPFFDPHVPHSGCPPPFFFLAMLTHFCLNHLRSPPLYSLSINPPQLTQ